MTALSDEKFVEEAAALGFELSSVWDLTRPRQKYQPLIPLLVEWLEHVDTVAPFDLEYAHFVRGILNALMTRQAQGVAGPALVRMFERIGPVLGLRSSASLALASAADEEVYNDLERLLLDDSYGLDRFNLIDAIGLAGGERSLPVLRELVGGEIENRVPKQLGLFGDMSDVELLERFADSDEAWVRNSAAKAIEKIRSRHGESTPS